MSNPQGVIPEVTVATHLFSGIINRFKYSAMDAADRKMRETIDDQIEQRRQKPKPQDREDRE